MFIGIVPASFWLTAVSNVSVCQKSCGCTETYNVLMSQTIVFCFLFLGCGDFKYKNGLLNFYPFIVLQTIFLTVFMLNFEDLFVLKFFQFQSLRNIHEKIMSNWQQLVNSNSNLASDDKSYSVTNWTEIKIEPTRYQTPLEKNYKSHWKHTT